ncbi:hypothetical protein F5Y08DRAFT_86252 [Xylaria arbuscula]|nr:hypothetical protein F5Y08DRAFT_86252 [Xylaria arbuscula]
MDYQFEDGVPTLAVHNLDFAVREYLLLQDQHEELCQRLNQLSPTFSLSSKSTAATTTTTALSTAATSPSVSPTPSLFGRDSLSPSPPAQHQQQQQHMTSQTWMPSPSPGFSSSRNRSHHRNHQQHHQQYQPQRLTVRGDESLVGEVAAGEQKLFDVNEGMKRALTELLNCEAVRRDKAMRTWVQTRLMETEKELRRGRRRRSSATSD